VPQIVPANVRYFGAIATDTELSAQVMFVVVEEVKYPFVLDSFWIVVSLNP
jgi:hypothetical protein